jgi:hypothetical protein
MLVRQHTSNQLGNAKLWVSEAVAREDKMFDKPLWRRERTPDDEYYERDIYQHNAIQFGYRAKRPVKLLNW